MDFTQKKKIHSSLLSLTVFQNRLTFLWDTKGKCCTVCTDSSVLSNYNEWGIQLFSFKKEAKSSFLYNKKIINTTLSTISKTSEVNKWTWSADSLKRSKCQEQFVHFILYFDVLYQRETDYQKINKCVVLSWFYPSVLIGRRQVTWLHKTHAWMNSSQEDR